MARMKWIRKLLVGVVVVGLAYLVAFGFCIVISGEVPALYSRYDSFQPQLGAAAAFASAESLTAVVTERVECCLCEDRSLSEFQIRAYSTKDSCEQKSEAMASASRCRKVNVLGNSCALFSISKIGNQISCVSKDLVYLDGNQRRVLSANNFVSPCSLQSSMLSPPR